MTTAPLPIHESSSDSYTPVMPLIGIDCRFAATRSGLGTYTRSIVSALTRRSDPWSYVLFVQSSNDDWLRDVRRDNVTVIEVAIPHYSLAEQFRFPGIIRRSGCDLFYAPHFNVPLGCTVPFVPTIHDLILHRFPGEASMIKRMAYRVIAAHAVKRARRIIAVSRSSADEIEAIYGSSARRRTEVIHPGVSTVFSPRSIGEQQTVRSTFALHRPFLLYVGGNKSHKNIPLLIDAFQHAAIENVDLVLVSRNATGLGPSDRIHWLEGVTDSDLAALYSAALGSVTATLAEGFYFPAVEAMACGCPVLATNAGAIPDVCDGHALIVEPDRDALASGMRTIVADVRLRTPEHRLALTAYAKTFSWERTTQQTAAVFRSIVRS